MQSAESQTVILADDHPGFLEGIKLYFQSRQDFEIIGETNNGENCIALIRKLHPDWAVVDLAMPKSNGFDVLSETLEQGIMTHIIVMSMYADEAYAKKAEELGAVAFIAKEDAISELDTALLSRHDKFFASASVGRRTPAFMDQDSLQNLQSLTPAEKNVLQYLGDGYTSREIAEALDISPRTVQKHRQNMSKKLGLHGPNRLLEYAVKNVRRLKINMRSGEI